MNQAVLALALVRAVLGKEEAVQRVNTGALSAAWLDEFYFEVRLSANDPSGSNVSLYFMKHASLGGLRAKQDLR